MEMQGGVLVAKKERGGFGLATFATGIAFATGHATATGLAAGLARRRRRTLTGHCE